MGLSAPKKRNKISDDPNNLSWANSTDGFGHNILTAKGWKPGEYLGSKGAAHAGHYTAANASSIRVMLREENLGLGAQIGKANAETFGLSMFSSLLGRLNGKDDATIQAQETAQRDIGLRIYQAEKYGSTSFVYGGLLVGDEMKEREVGLKQEEVKSDDSTIVSDRSKRKTHEDTYAIKEHRSRKKRKREKRQIHDRDTNSGTEVIEGISNVDLDDEEDSKKAPTPENDYLPPEQEAADKKTKRKKSRQVQGADIGETDSIRDKRARKDERRRRKEEKRRKKTAKENAAASSDTNSSSKPHEISQPIPTATNRNAVRQRYIQQKRMASLNPQALKEIFMFSATS